MAAQRRRDNHDPAHFETSEGVKVRLKPVSQMLLAKIRLGYQKRFREAGEPIDTPTRIAKTVAGEEVELTLDADSLEIPGKPEETAENERLWAEHQAALERLNLVLQEELMSCVLARGVELTEREGWESEQERFGVEIPEDPIDRKIHYITTELVQTPRDMANLYMAIIRLSNRGAVDEEALEAAEATFRDSVRAGQENDESGQTADSAGGVAPLDEANGSPNGENVGNGAKSIPISG